MLFNYNTLEVTLDKETRSLSILLSRPEKKNAINVEMIFELESLLGWLTSHIEVNAIYLSGSGDFFCSGFDQDELKIMSPEKLHKYLVRFQKLTLALQHLPQTIICDIKTGTSGMGIELSLAADIRIAQEQCRVVFDNLLKGWVPCAGGVSTLSHLVGPSLARQWTLSSAIVKTPKLLLSGLILDSYKENQNFADELLRRIFKQAPVSRIQTKRSFLEEALPEIERGQEYEFAFATAAMKTDDWKKEEQEDFTTAREMGSKVKKDDRPHPRVDH